MDRNFARALTLVLKSEGGWSDMPADPGGATMKGVTLATFRAYIKPGGTKADLRAITDEQLSACYRKEYWNAVAGDALPDGVDYAVFDFAVNSGPGRAAKYLQAVVGVAQDGTIGPATLAAVAAKPSGVIIDTLCDNRLAFLKHLPTWGTFGKGWASRVASVRRDALLMSAAPKIAAPAPQPAPPAPVPASPAPQTPAPVPAAVVVPVARPREPVISEQQPPANPEKSGVSKPTAAAAGLLVLIAGALAHWWSEFSAWVSNLF